MTAEKRSFNDALEPLFYWDTAFTISFFIESERYHKECLAFRHRLDAEGSLSAVSDLVYNELAFYLLKRALLEEGQRTGQYWLDVKRNRPDVIIKTMPDVDAKRAELDRIAINLPSGEGVKERAFQLMRDYALLPTDAYHIAVALDAGINAFASVDEDFLQVDNIIVYTCLP